MSAPAMFTAPGPIPFHLAPGVLSALLEIYPRMVSDWRTLPGSDQPRFLDLLSLLSDQGLIEAIFIVSGMRDTLGAIEDARIRGLTPQGIAAAMSAPASAPIVAERAATPPPVQVAPDVGDGREQPREAAPVGEGETAMRRRRIAEIITGLLELDPELDPERMPGTKADFHNFCKALSEDDRRLFLKAPDTFADYLPGLCKFGRGARQTDYYKSLLPKWGQIGVT